MSSGATVGAAAGTAAAAPSTSGGTSTRRSGGALQPQPSPSPAAAVGPLRLLVDRWDAARAVTTQLDACMRADQQAAGEAQTTSTGAATAATAAATASASSAPAPSVTLYRRYRITLLLECGPSLLATLQPGSARILSQMLGCACRRALAQLHHAATKFGLTIFVTVVCACVGAHPSALPSFHVLVNNFRLGSVDPTSEVQSRTRAAAAATANDKATAAGESAGGAPSSESRAAQRSRSQERPSRSPPLEQRQQQRPRHRTSGPSSRSSSAGDLPRSGHSSTADSGAEDEPGAAAGGRARASAGWGTAAASAAVTAASGHPNSSLAALFDQLAHGLDDVENGWIEARQARARLLRAERRRRAQGKAPSASASAHLRADAMAAPVDVRQLLLSGLFALSRMDSSACPLLLLFTDGIMTVPQVAPQQDPVYNTLLQQHVALHVCQLNGSPHAAALSLAAAGNGAPGGPALPQSLLADPFSFGYVPDFDLLRFLCWTTGGLVHDVDALALAGTTPTATATAGVPCLPADAVAGAHSTYALADPYAPASFRPSKLRAHAHSKHKRREVRRSHSRKDLSGGSGGGGGGGRDNRAGNDDDDEEEAFLASTRIANPRPVLPASISTITSRTFMRSSSGGPLASIAASPLPPASPSPSLSLSLPLHPNPDDDDEAPGFEFESDTRRKLRRKGRTASGSSVASLSPGGGVGVGIAGLAVAEEGEDGSGGEGVEEESSEEEELEQIDDESEEEEESNSDSREGYSSSSSNRGGKQLLWDDLPRAADADAELSDSSGSTPSPSASGRDRDRDSLDPLSLSTQSLASGASGSSLLLASSTALLPAPEKEKRREEALAAFLAGEGFAQSLLLKYSGLTTTPATAAAAAAVDVSAVAAHPSESALPTTRFPAWALPRYRCTQQWNKVAPGEGKRMQLRKLILPAHVQAQRLPLHLLPVPSAAAFASAPADAFFSMPLGMAGWACDAAAAVPPVPDLCCTPVQSYQLSHMSVASIAAARLKEGFLSAHWTTSALPHASAGDSVGAKRCCLTWRMEWKQGVHIEYGMEWTAPHAAAPAAAASSGEPMSSSTLLPRILVTVWLVAEADFLRSFLRLTEGTAARVPSLPPGVAAHPPSSLLAPDRSDVEGIELLLSSIQTSDLMLLQLQRVGLTSAERALFDEAVAAAATSEAVQQVQGNWLLRLSRSVTPLRAHFHLSVLPPSSYLSNTHPLWRKLATASWPLLRRWMNVGEGIDVVCSVHRTLQVNNLAEQMGGQSQALLHSRRSSGDSDGASSTVTTSSSDPAAQNSEKGVGTFVITWMELELELQAMQQQQQQQQRAKPTSPGQTQPSPPHPRQQSSPIEPAGLRSLVVVAAPPPMDTSDGANGVGGGGGEMSLRKEDEADPDEDGCIEEESAVPDSFESSKPATPNPTLDTISSPQHQMTLAPLASPALASSFLSDASSTFSLSSRLTQQSVMSALAALLGLCASIALSDKQWLIFVPPSWIGGSAAPPSSVPSDVADEVAPPPFLLLRLRWTTPFLASIDVATFGLDHSSRSSLLQRLRETIVNSYLLHQKQPDKQAKERVTESGGSYHHTPAMSPMEHPHFGGGGGSGGGGVSGVGTVTGTLHMFVPGTAGTVPSTPLHTGAGTGASTSGNKSILTKLYPFGITSRPLSKVLLLPQSTVPQQVNPAEPGAPIVAAPASTATPAGASALVPSFSSGRSSSTRAYMLHRSCHWKLSNSGTMSTALALLRKARMEEGFVMTHSTVGAGASTTYAREIPITQRSGQDRSGGRSDGAEHSVDDASTSTTQCLLQYCVHQVDGVELETEVWMESFSGFWCVPGEACTNTFLAVLEGKHQKQSKGHKSSASAVRWVGSDELFDELCAWFHACDLHLLSIVATFDTVRDLEFSPGTAAQLSYLQQPTLQRNRSFESQGSSTGGSAAAGGASGDSGSSSKLGLELALDLDFHADLSFSFRYDARRRARLCRSRLAVESAAHLDRGAKTQADGARLAQVEQRIQESVMTPLLASIRQSQAPGQPITLPPPISLLQVPGQSMPTGNANSLRPPSHPHASSTAALGSDLQMGSPSLGSLADPSYGLSPGALYSALLSPAVSPSSSQANLLALQLGNLGLGAGLGLMGASPCVSGSPSPLMSPSSSSSSWGANGSHSRSRSSIYGAGGSSFTLPSYPASPHISPDSSTRRIHPGHHGSGAHHSHQHHHRSVSDLSGRLHPSASQTSFTASSSKKNLHTSASMHVRPSSQQEDFARQHGALVPLSLTYLLDCSASTPLYFPVPALDHSAAIAAAAAAAAASATASEPASSSGAKDAAGNGGEPLVVAGPTTGASNPSRTSPLSRSISMPEQLSQGMKEAMGASFAPHFSLSSVPSSGSGLGGSARDSRSAAAAASLLRLQHMLVTAVRRQSDLELVSNRVFAQLVNEYTIIFLLLPGQHTRKRMMQAGRRIARQHRKQQERKTRTAGAAAINATAAATATATAGVEVPAASLDASPSSSPASATASTNVTPDAGDALSDDDDSDADDDPDESEFDDQDDEDTARDDVDWYLDCLLAARGYSPIELSHLWQTDQAHTRAHAHAAHNPAKLPELCAVLFECNRDEFGHPRTFPFPPPPSLPTFGSLPAVLPPAHALLPLFPPPGPANVGLALLADGRPHLLPHTYLFLQGRLAKHTLHAWRRAQQRVSSKIVREVSGMVRQSSLQRLVRARGSINEHAVPLQRHRRFLQQQLFYVDALRHLFSTPPLSCVAKQLPQLPHAIGGVSASASGSASGSRHASDDFAPSSTTAMVRKSSRATSDSSIALVPYVTPNLAPLSLDGSGLNPLMGDLALVLALPSPSSSSPMFAAASHLLSFHARILGAHMRNFVRGVYLCLVEGQRVARADVVRAMRGCAVFAAEVDVSLIQCAEWRHEVDEAMTTSAVATAAASLGHFMHGAHAHKRSGSSSLSLPPLPPPLTPLLADTTPAAEQVCPPKPVALDPSHPLSRASIVARVRARFEKLLSAQFEPVEAPTASAADAHAPPSGLGLYFHRPPSRSPAPSPLSAAASVHALNPRPMPTSGTQLSTASNKLPPMGLLGPAIGGGSGGGSASSSGLPPLSSKPPLLTKAMSLSSGVSAVAGGASSASVVPRTLAGLAAQSGISILAGGSSGPSSSGSASSIPGLSSFQFPSSSSSSSAAFRGRGGVMQLHSHPQQTLPQALAPEHSTPFFLQLECLIYVVQPPAPAPVAAVPERVGTPVQSSTAATVALTGTPANAPASATAAAAAQSAHSHPHPSPPSSSSYSPRLSLHRAISRPTSPVPSTALTPVQMSTTAQSTKPPLAPRIESPSNSPRIRSQSFSFAGTGAGAAGSVSLGSPALASSAGVPPPHSSAHSSRASLLPRQPLSRQQSSQRPFVVPVSLQSSVADILADAIAQRIAVVVQGVHAAHARVGSSPMGPPSGPAATTTTTFFSSPMAAPTLTPTTATASAGGLHEQLLQALHTAASVRTVLRLKCITLRTTKPRRSDDGGPLMWEYDSNTRDEDSFAHLVGSPFAHGDEDANEEERFPLSVHQHQQHFSRRPSLGRPTGQLASSPHTYSNDFEAEHGTDDSGQQPSVSLYNNAGSGGGGGVASSSSLQHGDRVLTLSQLPSYLRQVMSTLSRSIELLVAEEVLHTLLTLQPVHVDTLQLVAKQVETIVRATATDATKRTAAAAAAAATERNRQEGDAPKSGVDGDSDVALHFHPYPFADRPPISGGTVSLLSIPLRFVPAEQDRARALFPTELARVCVATPPSPPTSSTAAAAVRAQSQLQQPSSTRSVTHSGLVFFPPPAGPQLHARSLIVSHRPLYYLVDLLPAQMETFHTLKGGANMNDHELDLGVAGAAGAGAAGGAGPTQPRSRTSSVANSPTREQERERDHRRSSHPSVRVDEGEDDDENEAERSAMTAASATAAGASGAVSARPLPFWFLFSLSADARSLHVTFHHALLSAAQVGFVLEHFHRTVSSVVHRVNQICLLNLLHATRVCSALLIPNQREESAPSASGASAALQGSMHPPTPSGFSGFGGGGGGSSSGHSFLPGDLSCPKVLSVQFSLHDRLHPSIALRNIGPLALHPFTVNNRRNVYVYQEKSGAVYILKLSTIEAQASAAAGGGGGTAGGGGGAAASHMHTHSSTAHASASVSRRHSGGEEMGAHFPSSGSTIGSGASQSHHHHHRDASHASMTPMSPAFYQSSGSGGGNVPHLAGAGNALLLDIYGLSEPGEEITVQLHSLLQAKLSAFTLSLLAQMLARNPLFKLTSADHRFIRVPDTPPVKAVAFPLLSHLRLEGHGHGHGHGQPHAAASALVLRDPYLFLQYLKPNLDRFFTPLCLSYTVDREKERAEREVAARERRDAAWGVHASQEVTEIDMWDFIENQKMIAAAAAASPAGAAQAQAELAAEEAAESARKLMAPIAAGGGGWGEPANLLSSKLFFLFNNFHTNPSSAALQNELGKGLSSIYLSLAAPSGLAPMKTLQTHAHEPWHAQSAEDMAQWSRLGSDLRKAEARRSAAVQQGPPSGSGADTTLPPPSLPSIPVLDLSPRVGGFSSVYDHVTAGSSSASGEGDPDERVQVLDYVDARAREEVLGSLCGSSSGGDGSSPSPFWLVAEVWSQGSVNHDALMSRVHTIVNQSVHEYWLETIMFAHRVNAHAGRVPRPIREPRSSGANRLASSALQLAHGSPPSASATTPALLLRSFDRDLVRPLGALLPSLLSLSAPASGQVSASQRLAWTAPQAHWSPDQLLPQLAKLVAGVHPSLGEDLLAYTKPLPASASPASARRRTAAWDGYQLVSLDESKEKAEQPSPTHRGIALASSHKGAQTYVLLGGFGVRGEEESSASASSSSAVVAVNAHRSSQSQSQSHSQAQPLAPSPRVSIMGSSASFSSPPPAASGSVTSRPHTPAAGSGTPQQRASPALTPTPEGRALPPRQLLQRNLSREGSVGAEAKNEAKRAVVADARPRNNNPSMDECSSAVGAPRRYSASVSRSQQGAHPSVSSRLSLSSRSPTLRHAVSLARRGGGGGDLLLSSAGHGSVAAFSENQALLHAHMRLSIDLANRVRERHRESHSGPHAPPSPLSLAAFKVVSVGKGGGSDQPLARERDRDRDRERSNSTAMGGAPAEPLTLFRHSSIVVHLTTHALEIWTYNWKPALVDSLALGVGRLLAWSCWRHTLLRQVLHQKLGLFQHQAAALVPSQLPCVQRNFNPVAQLSAQTHGAGSGAAEGEPASSSSSLALGCFSLHNIDLLVQHTTPPIRGQSSRNVVAGASSSSSSAPAHGHAATSASSAAPGAQSLATSAAATATASAMTSPSNNSGAPNAGPAGGSVGRAPPNAASMSAADIAREKMARQRMQMYSRIRGGGPGAAFGGAPAHLNRGGGGRGGPSGGGSGGPGMGGMESRSSSSSNAVVSNVDVTQGPLSSRAAIPHPVSVASPMSASPNSGGSGGGASQAPGGGVTPGSTAVPPPMLHPRSRSGSTVTPGGESIVTPTFTPRGLSGSSGGAMVVSPPPSTVRNNNARSMSFSAPAPPPSAALLSLQGLMASRMRSFARLLRGVSPPIGFQRSRNGNGNNAAAASRAGRRARDPLQFHASQLKQLVNLSSDFYSRPLDTLNLCWHWLQATALAPHNQPGPGRPRLDAATLQFLKYLTQMARQVKQVRVPLFFNRLVAQWMDQRAGQGMEDDAAAMGLPSALPSLLSLSALPGAGVGGSPPPGSSSPSSLLLHLSLLDSFLSEFVAFVEREFGFSLVAVVSNADAAAQHSASDNNMHASGSRLTPSASEVALDQLKASSGGDAPLRAKSRSGRGGAAVASALQTPAVPLTLLANLPALLAPLSERMSSAQGNGHPTLPLQPLPCASIQLASNAPQALLPPLRVVLRKLFHGYTCLLTVEFSGSLVVTSLSMAPLPKSEKNPAASAAAAAAANASASRRSGLRSVHQSAGASAGMANNSSQLATLRPPSSASKPKNNYSNKSAGNTPGGSMSRVGSSGQLEQMQQQPIANWPMVAAQSYGSTAAGLSSSSSGAAAQVSPPIAAARSSAASSTTPAAGVSPPSFDSLSDLRVAASVYSRVLELSRCLHLHSFLYDFHLRHFASFVMEPSVAYPNMDLLAQLRAFHTFYPSPPQHARNHMVRRDFSVTLPVDLADPADFFGYLVANAAKYGLGHLQHRGANNVVFLSSAMGAGAQARPSPPPPSAQDDAPRGSSRPVVAAGSPIVTSLAPPGGAVVSAAVAAPSPSSINASPFLYLFIAFLAPESGGTSTLSPVASAHAAAAATSPRGSSFFPSRHASFSSDIATPSSRGGGGGLHAGPAAASGTADHSRVKLQYYIMRIDPHNRTPLVHAHPPPNVAAAAGAGGAAGGSSSTLDRHAKSASAHWAELYEMMVSQVAVGAEKTIHRLCHKSLPHYQRDRVWQRLVRGGAGGGATSSDSSSLSSSSLGGGSASGSGSMVVDVDVSEVEFEVMRALTFRRPLHAIDAQLCELHTLGALHVQPPGALAQSLFTHLIKVYYGSVRQFTWRQHKHLFISNKRDPDSMLHVIVRLPSPAAARSNDARRNPALASAEARAAMSSPFGVPRGWLDGATDTDSSGATPADSSPFKFIACRRQLTQMSNPHELELITHFTNTVTHWCWSFLTA